MIPIASEDAEQQELPISAGNAKWFSHTEGQWQFLPKVNTVLPYDPAIVLLGIDSTEMKMHVHRKPLSKCL